jgi:hypothetical protein
MEKQTLYNYEIIVKGQKYNVVGTIVEANNEGLLIECNYEPVFVTNKRYIINNIGLYNG